MDAVVASARSPRLAPVSASGAGGSRCSGRRGGAERSAVGGPGVQRLQARSLRRRAAGGPAPRPRPTSPSSPDDRQRAGRRRLPAGAARHRGGPRGARPAAPPPVPPPLQAPTPAAVPRRFAPAALDAPPELPAAPAAPLAPPSTSHCVVPPAGPRRRAGSRPRAAAAGPAVTALPAASPFVAPAAVPVHVQSRADADETEEPQLVGAVVPDHGRHGARPGAPRRRRLIGGQERRPAMTGCKPDPGALASGRFAVHSDVRAPEVFARPQIRVHRKASRAVPGPPVRDRSARRTGRAG